MNGRSASTFDRGTPPGVGPAPPVRLPRSTELVLSNGLRVVLVPSHRVPVVSLVLQVPGGGWEVTPDRAGLAALTSDMLDEGTQERSALGIASEMERLGAGLVSYAGRDASTVRLSVVRDRFEAALELFADVVTRPVFPEAELTRVRSDQVTRILQGTAEARVLADEALARVLYGDEHPYGVPVLGRRATVEALGRAEVADFYDRWHGPGDARLVVTGDVRRDDLEALLESALSHWTGGAPARTAHPEPDRPAATTIYVVDKPGAAQSEIRVGRLATRRKTDDYQVIAVLNTVLGGSFTSRLNLKLREEKGYTYGARSSFALRRSTGPFVAGAAVHTPATDDAVMDFLYEIGRMASDPVPEPELERARSYVALRLPQGFETVSDLAARISELVLYDLPLDYYEGFVDGVLRVTADDVQQTARTYLEGGLAVVVAGDRASIEPPLRALGVGDVVVLPGPERADAPPA